MDYAFTVQSTAHLVEPATHNSKCVSGVHKGFAPHPYTPGFGFCNLLPFGAYATLHVELGKEMYSNFQFIAKPTHSYTKPVATPHLATKLFSVKTALILSIFSA